MSLEALFSPIKIGVMEVKNRIVMPAMHLNYTMSGEITDQIVDFYRERAEGGVGLIIIGGCPVDRVGGAPIMVRLDEDRFVDGLSRFVREVRTEGVKLAAQLYHAGRYAYSALTGMQTVSASAVRSSYNNEMPRALTGDEILEIEDAFAKAAARAKMAGFDAVEVLASAGYLISQFLSPVTNLRDDEYGGDIIEIDPETSGEDQ